jgi:nicotinate phosphoribosyltransferase
MTTTSFAALAARPVPTDHGERTREFHARLHALPASTFAFDRRMAEGYYADAYFPRSARVLAFAGKDPVVRLQLFAKKHGVIAGVYEAIRMIQTQLARGSAATRCRFRDIEIDTLMDGDPVSPRETVMHIRVPYRAIAHLETTYLGVLARRTLVATNTRRVIEAANGKPVIFMAARHDDWRVEVPDGYAALVGGAGAVSTDANGAWWGERGVGTMPHALIACFNGDTVAATVEYYRYVRAKEPGLQVMSLVDYDNDVIDTSLAVARRMRELFGDGALWAVRVDTSEMVVDRSLEGREAEFPGEKLHGVTAPLIRELRKALDDDGHTGVQICVSGGFTPTKIASFEEGKVPADLYGVGSSLLGHNNGERDGLVNGFDFTADIVTVDGRDESKFGRGRRDNGRLIHLDHPLLDQLEQENR